jgi:hypothetical protein
MSASNLSDQSNSEIDFDFDFQGFFLLLRKAGNEMKDVEFEMNKSNISSENWRVFIFNFIYKILSLSQTTVYL